MVSFSEEVSIGEMRPKLTSCAQMNCGEDRRFFMETVFGVVLLLLRHRDITLGEKSNDDPSIGRSGVKGDISRAVT